MMQLRPALKAIPAYIPGKPIEELERELGIVGALSLIHI